ncbi:MAG: hypothetical protein KC777_03815 [Cyanobacteria bacterium HKST-UBA02]|nr:hypothetical protein [Cyanobacteria bacterium HKST-UBA02]
MEETPVLTLFEEFETRFPSEDDCVEELYCCLVEGEAVCRHCDSFAISRDAGSRVIDCLRCGRRTWFTAGTFFERIRSVRPWLLAMWILERGGALSASVLQRLSGVAYSSAHALLKKLSMVAGEAMSGKSFLVSSSRFSAVFSRRSRETPARRHPIAEQEELEGRQDKLQYQEQDCQGELIDSRISGIFGNETMICDLLKDGPVNFDTMSEESGLDSGALSASLAMLELDCVVRRIAGDVYEYVPIPRLEDDLARCGESGEAGMALLEGLIERFGSFIRDVYKGISRKYLQGYLGLFWLRIDRKFWRPGALLDHCCRYGEMSGRSIREYVTPLVVEVVG